MPRITTLVAAAGLVFGTLPLSSCGDDSGGTGATSGSAAAANRDFAAEAREVIRSHQPDPDGDNAWDDFIRLCDTAEAQLVAFEAEPAVQTWLAAQKPQGGATADDLLAHVLQDMLDDSDQVGPAQREAVRAFLDRLEQTGLFEQLDALTKETCFVPPMEGPLQSMPAPWLGGTRGLARICAVRLMQQAQAGDADGANEDEVVRSFNHLLALERAVASEISTMARLVSLAVRAPGVYALAEMIDADEMSPALARRLGEAMDAHEPLPLEMTIGTERLIALDTVARAGGAVEGAVAAAGGDEGLTRESQTEAIRMIDTYTDGLRDWASDDAARRKAGAAAIEEILWECQRHDPSPHAMLVSMVLPAPKVVNSVRRLEAQTVGVRTMLAIAEFEAAHGRPPATLDELVPEYLAAVPLDPYAIEGAGAKGLAPLRYRVLEKDADEHGRAYLLYTVAADGEDDGGRIAPRSMMNAFANEGRGCDFVFTHRSGSKGAPGASGEQPCSSRRRFEHATRRAKAFPRSLRSARSLACASGS